MKRMPGGSGNNPFAQLIEDAEGLDKIEALQVRYERLQIASTHRTVLCLQGRLLYVAAQHQPCADPVVFGRCDFQSPVMQQCALARRQLQTVLLS